MTAAMVGRMAEALRPGDAVAAAFAGEDFHALCAVLRVSAAGAIEAALADGGHPSVRALWRQMGLTEVRFDDAAAFTNVNRPEDLKGLD
jgi:molybdopterin-guanine dinucleotide biosynthesis protein A